MGVRWVENWFCLMFGSFVLGSGVWVVWASTCPMGRKTKQIIIIIISRTKKVLILHNRRKNK